MSSEAATLATAALGGLGALLLAYINSFVREQYVRHLDAASIAAGLAGELGSYAQAWPLIRQALNSYLLALDAGKKHEQTFRPFDRPKDVFYEANASRLGLLGPELSKDIAFVYGQIGGFRVSFGLLLSHGAEMSDEEFRLRVMATLGALDRAAEHGKPLLAALSKKASAGFMSAAI